MSHAVQLDEVFINRCELSLFHAEFEYYSERNVIKMSRIDLHVDGKI